MSVAQVNLSQPASSGTHSCDPSKIHSLKLLKRGRDGYRSLFGELEEMNEKGSLRFLPNEDGVGMQSVRAILCSTNAPLTDSVKLGWISVADLGLCDGADFDQVRDISISGPFKDCPNWATMKFRQKYQGQPVNDSLLVMMEPVLHPKYRRRCIPVLSRNSCSFVIRTQCVENHHLPPETKLLVSY